MKKLVVGILILGLANLSNAQGANSAMNLVPLNSIDVAATNLEYLAATKVYNMPNRVLELEKKASKYTIKKSFVFGLGAKEQEIAFGKDNGEIVATYNKDGKILKSNERFEQITFPYQIRNAIFNQYPDYTIHKSVYLVSYDHQEGISQVYKAQIRKNNKKINLKLDGNGNLLE